jgi:hypothetical protein
MRSALPFFVYKPKSFYLFDTHFIIMNLVNKSLISPFIFFLILSSLLVLTVTPVTVQAGFKPSVPQFTVKLVDNLIEVTIKNQPFTPYNDESAKDIENGIDMYGPNGKEFNLYYDVQVKGPPSGVWYNFCDYIVQSNSSYTVVSQVLNPIYDTYDAGVQLDFRVSAVLMYKYNYACDPSSPFPPQWGKKTEVQSDWSNVQTVTVSATSPSQTATLPSPSGTLDDNRQPQPPNFIFNNSLFLLSVVVLFGGVVIVVVIVILRRLTKTSASGVGSVRH